MGQPKHTSTCSRACITDGTHDDPGEGAIADAAAVARVDAQGGDLSIRAITCDKSAFQGEFGFIKRVDQGG